MGFLKSLNRGDAGLYLQGSAASGANLERRVKQFRALRRSFNGDIGDLSNDPNGTLEMETLCDTGRRTAERGGSNPILRKAILWC